MVVAVLTIVSLALVTVYFRESDGGASPSDAPSASTMRLSAWVARRRKKSWRVSWVICR